MPWASNSSTLYAVWICLILWAEGAHFVVIPSALKEIYGKEADTIYALIFSYSGIAALLMLIVVRSSFGKDYETIIKFSSGLSLVAFLILILVFKEQSVAKKHVDVIIHS